MTDALRATGSQQVELANLGDEKLHELARRYVSAWERGDVDAILAMLTDDAVLDAAAASVVRGP
ncbi:nuclear transport factor 2 family protein [Micromonospora zamorensis]|uniref:nuclear transport factor 2 family protein n=1 Tax=Micromonospora zamorensis TaxID=709883 RepID=UPI003D95AC4D